jgi:hypothetical protein
MDRKTKKRANRSHRTEKRKLQLSPNKLNRNLMPCRQKCTKTERTFLPKSKKVHFAYYTMHKIIQFVWHIHYIIIFRICKPLYKNISFGAGNNPMVGMTVAVAVAIEEASK